MSDPLVSAIMVTGKDPARLPFAIAAVRSFLQQSWSNKELIIISDDFLLMPFLFHEEIIDLETAKLLVRECNHRSGRTLGELRNEGLKRAEGDWIIQWDDDDWHHPDRIAVQMEARKPGHAVLLLHQVRYSFLNNSAKTLRWPWKPNPGIPGTVLHPNRSGIYYQAERKGEDDHFLQDHFKDSMVVVDNASRPELYLRFFHGSNTWDHKHVMGKHSDASMKNAWSLPDSAREYLGGVLRGHYAFALRENA